MTYKWLNLDSLVFWHLMTNDSNKKEATNNYSKPNNASVMTTISVKSMKKACLSLIHGHCFLIKSIMFLVYCLMKNKYDDIMLWLQIFIPQWPFAGWTKQINVTFCKKAGMHETSKMRTNQWQTSFPQVSHLRTPQSHTKKFSRVHSVLS